MYWDRDPWHVDEYGEMTKDNMYGQHYNDLWRGPKTIGDETHFCLTDFPQAWSYLLFCATSYPLPIPRHRILIAPPKIAVRQDGHILSVKLLIIAESFEAEHMI